MRGLLAVLGASVAISVLDVNTAAAFALDERTEAVFHDRYGQVVSGTKFGITVGEPWATADATIRRQFKPKYILWSAEKPRLLGSDPILVGDAKVSYRDASWRDGVITLALRDGSVTAIAWHYAGPFYLDF